MKSFWILPVWCLDILYTTAPLDYTSVTNQLTFGPGTQKLTVDIMNDNLDEPEEEFMATLTLITHSSNVRVYPDLATIRIIDDDGNNY